MSQLGLIMSQKFVLAMVWVRSDHDWINILFIFDLVYKRTENLCEMAQGSGPFTRLTGSRHTDGVGRRDEREREREREREEGEVEDKSILAILKKKIS
jgi:hypothetical protein